MELIRGLVGYDRTIMPQRPHKFLWLLLALLLSVQPLVPTAAYAEAQMRCAGMATSSRPCARIPISTNGLTAPKAYIALMACCHLAKSGCAMHQGCPAMRGSQIIGTSPRRAAFSTPRCLVTILASPASRAFLAPQRAKWLLAAAPALAPPTASAPFDCCPAATESQSHPRAAIFPPRLLPYLNGLRAPPAA